MTREVKKTKKITKRRVGRYSDAIREQAAIEYAVCGSLRQVSKILDIKESTLSDWKQKGRMDETIVRVRDEKTNELRAKYIDVCELAIDHTKKTLPEATPAQSAVISGVFFDKVRLIDNQPTTIRSDSQSMQDLADSFRKLSREYRTVGSTYKVLKDKG